MLPKDKRAGQSWAVFRKSTAGRFRPRRSGRLARRGVSYSFGGRDPCRVRVRGRKVRGTSLPSDPRGDGAAMILVD